MATDFIMPRMPDPQQQSAFFQPQQMFAPPQAVQMPAAYQPQPQVPQYQQHQQQHQPQTHQQQNYNPQISPLSTSGNASPTSPKSYMTRQTRPMYMPAVLRPNEFPSKAPQRAKTIDVETEDRALRSSGSYLSLTGLGALGRLSRRSTGDSGKCLDSVWNLDMFPKPTGVPTRKHWKPDQEAVICDDATCKRYFSYFTRRHHCRKCGNIFCDSHSSFEVPLDQEANYNPHGALSRACQHCFSDFKEWRSRANSRSSSTESTDAANNPTPTSPIDASSALPKLAKSLSQTPQAMSVPRDWNWSTF